MCFLKIRKDFICACYNNSDKCTLDKCMSEKVSNKIVCLNFTLACLIVLIHSCDILKVDEFSNISITPVFRFIFTSLGKLGSIAVPSFFSLSGYLFFRNISSKNVLMKLRRRIKSIVIPLLIWDLVFYFIYIILFMIPGVGGKMNFQLPNIDIQYFIGVNSVNPPMWFLTRLLLLQITGPLLIMFFNWFGKKSIVFIIILAIVNVVFEINYFNPVHWMTNFYLGGYISYFFKEYEDMELQLKKPMRLLVLFIMIILLYFVDSWIIGPILVYFIFASYNINVSERYKALMSYGFFSMCTHYFFVRLYRKVFEIAFGTSNELAMLINLLMTWIVVIITVNCLGKIIKKLFPKSYSLATGGR